MCLGAMGSKTRWLGRRRSGPDTDHRIAHQIADRRSRIPCQADSGLDVVRIEMKHPSADDSAISVTMFSQEPSFANRSPTLSIGKAGTAASYRTRNSAEVTSTGRVNLVTPYRMVSFDDLFTA
jgi:hypothetical protein